MQSSHPPSWNGINATPPPTTRTLFPPPVSRDDDPLPSSNYNRHNFLKKAEGKKRGEKGTREGKKSERAGCRKAEKTFSNGRRRGAGGVTTARRREEWDGVDLSRQTLAPRGVVPSSPPVSHYPTFCPIEIAREFLATLPGPLGATPAPCAPPRDLGNSVWKVAHSSTPLTVSTCGDLPPNPISSGYTHSRGISSPTPPSCGENTFRARGTRVFNFSFLAERRGGERRTNERND